MSQLLHTDLTSSLIKENVQGGAFDTVFRRTDLLNFLSSQGRVRRWMGGQPQQWNIVTTANSASEVFSEGAAAPVAGKQAYAQASLSPFYARVIAGYSGHVADNQRAGGMWIDPIQDAIVKGTADLWKKVEDTIVGSTADQGIQSVVDAGDTYAGLAPGSYSTHASIETAVGGALSFTVLEDNIETGALAMAKPTHILAPHNQLTNYIRLAGASAATSNVRYTPGTKDFGTGSAIDNLSYNGMPLVGISGLTTTVILMLDMTSDFAFEIFRDVEIKPLSSANDDTSVQISVAGALVCKVRRAHIKLTGVTA
jgi:hypothetical protein